VLGGAKKFISCGHLASVWDLYRTRTAYNKYAYITIPIMVDVRSFLWYSSEDSYKNCILNISFSFYSMGGGGGGGRDPGKAFLCLNIDVSGSRKFSFSYLIYYWRDKKKCPAA